MSYQATKRHGWILNTYHWVEQASLKIHTVWFQLFWLCDILEKAELKAVKGSLTSRGVVEGLVFENQGIFTWNYSIWWF